MKNDAVTVLTTKPQATDEDVCQRRVRNLESGHLKLVNVRRPVTIKDDEFMGGVHWHFGSDDQL